MCAGAEHASITARTNIQLAQTQVQQSQTLSADADKKLTETKVMEIERMAQHAASDEEEVPDAYLREDWEKKKCFWKMGKVIIKLLSHIVIFFLGAEGQVYIWVVSHVKKVQIMRTVM